MWWCGCLRQLPRPDGRARTSRQRRPASWKIKDAFPDGSNWPGWAAIRRNWTRPVARNRPFRCSKWCPSARMRIRHRNCAIFDVSWRNDRVTRSLTASWLWKWRRRPFRRHPGRTLATSLYLPECRTRLRKIAGRCKWSSRPFWPGSRQRTGRKLTFRPTVQGHVCNFN